MLEIYLFINPVGSQCYQSEKNILRLVDPLDNEVRFRFVPFLNLNTVTAIMNARHLPLNDLKIRNKIFNIVYQAALDYKAALFQGSRRGRNYLLNVQKHIIEYGEDYCDEIILEVAKKSNLDLEMFQKDRVSKFTVESFKRDQQMAAEMKIQSHPTAVLYDLDKFDFGVSFTDCASYDLLKDLCTGKFNTQLISTKKGESKYKEHPSIHIL
ncbi:DsbA family protein [Liquorilactobacillus oeni]|uniref:Dithiol-disulfide isomerase n=1 Tax=Liquorilactobacillus oeni DSM 19972 TaxID=1423777 RepID=A0A0R1MJW7_9LACO|nr:DsbA family protein [Liquorilactobacillus oeni]KRL04795.1 hypothetical protein FD46_GL001932 [Liquorilactobacillus oeni DSM 19972]